MAAVSVENNSPSSDDPGANTPDDFSHVKSKTPPKESSKRSFAKALTWRIIGTLDTFFLSFFIIKYLGPVFGWEGETGNLDIAGTASLIAITEVITKIVIYTLHERGWNLIGWGVSERHGKRHETRTRSATKMTTWRVAASLDTTLLALIFTGNLKVAISIGGIEILTKLILYFLHERLWLRLKFGLA